MDFPLKLLSLSSLFILLIKDSFVGSTTPRASTASPLISSQELASKILGKNISKILDSFKINYDKRVRPNYGAEAVEVKITMYVISISGFSESQMDFTLDFYFRQMWKDPRLTFEGPESIKTISVGGPEFLQTIWVPDTFFVNEKTSYFHTATTPNEFLRISSAGDVLRSIRLTVGATCVMDLRNFPMDSQLCTLEIESFGYTMSDLRYKWASPSAVGVSEDVSLPQFIVYGYRQKAHEISLSSGNYSRLVCEIQFVRSMGFYFIQVYIPSSLIVGMSWVSFWLNRNAAPARVSLGIITVLTMITLLSSNNKDLPKLDYVKAMDVFLGTCFILVFTALLEYAIVGYLAKRIQMRKAQAGELAALATKLRDKLKDEVEYETLKRQNEEETERLLYSTYNRNDYSRGSRRRTGEGYTRSGTVCVEMGAEQRLRDVENKLRVFIPINPNQICGITPSDIDKYSRVIFPVCFICFQMIYWITYLHISKVTQSDLILLDKEDN